MRTLRISGVNAVTERVQEGAGVEPAELNRLLHSEPLMRMRSFNG